LFVGLFVLRLVGWLVFSYLVFVCLLACLFV
jgi:hypothetical protein